MWSLHHPWTLGLATGSTNRESFKRYVAQDAYFLRAFAKAWVVLMQSVVAVLMKVTTRREHIFGRVLVLFFVAIFSS